MSCFFHTDGGAKFSCRNFTGSPTLEQSCRMCMNEQQRPRLGNHVVPLTDLYADEDMTSKKRRTPPAPRKVYPPTARKALVFPPGRASSPDVHESPIPAKKHQPWKTKTLSCTRNGEEMHTTITLEVSDSSAIVTADGLTLLDLWNKLK